MAIAVMLVRLLLNLTALLVMPVVLAGVIGRVKSLWSGRKGPPILQLGYDLLRLIQKRPIYSTTTTPLFWLGPHVFFVTSLCAGAIAPLLGSRGIASFPFDFVWFAYVWALGRVAIMLAALDAGSSFEGMGAAREAVFAAALEPALFLVAGALSFSGGHRALHEIAALELRAGGPTVVWVLAIVGLLIILQVETSRMPVDDPSTHLELTMVHEVMVLDHSGPDLAAIQLGTAIKLFVGSSLVATLLNPWSGSGGLLCGIANLGLCIGIAVLLGTVESLVARFRLRAVPQYIAVALACGGVALLAAIWRAGGSK
jgi:formate hydrogenlyase subunit 4